MTSDATMTVTVWNEHRADAQRRIDMMLGWCGRNGIAPPTFGWGDERLLGVRSYDERFRQRVWVDCADPSKLPEARAAAGGRHCTAPVDTFGCDLTIGGLDAVLKVAADTKLLGVLTHADGKTLPTVCHGCELPDWVLERHGECDHCNAKRQRAETFVVEVAGEVKVVGRTCIRPYLGIDPKRLAQAIEWIGKFGTSSRDACEDDDWIAPRNRTDRIALPTLVTAAVAAWRMNGCYTKKGRTNAQLVWTLINGPSTIGLRPEDREEVLKEFRDLKELAAAPDVIAEAATLIEWAKGLEGQGFELTLRATADAGFSVGRTHGAMIYLPEAWRRANGTAANRTDAKADWPAPTDAMPAVGIRTTFAARVGRVIPCEGQWGLSWLVLGRAADGFDFKTFTSSADFASACRAAERDRQPVTISGTVKRVDAPREGGERQAAVLTRCKALEGTAA